MTVLLCALLALGLFFALHRRVRRVRVRVPGLRRPYRLLQLSDLHVNRFTFPSTILRLARRIEREAPDCVVVTGDLVDDPPRLTRRKIACLARLPCPALLVVGNHERYCGGGIWPIVYHSLGFKVLQGRRWDAGPLLIAGVDDPAFSLRHRAQLVAVLAPPRAKPLVLLSHRLTSAVRLLAPLAGVSLVLAGHTHGGQLFPRGYGLRRIGATAVNLSCGAGFWWVPLRFGSWSEMVLVELLPVDGSSETG